MNKYKLSENAKEYWDHFFINCFHSDDYNIELVEKDLQVIIERINNRLKYEKESHYSHCFYTNIKGSVLPYKIYLPFIEEYFLEQDWGNATIDTEKWEIVLRTNKDLDYINTTRYYQENESINRYPDNSIWAKMHYCKRIPDEPFEDRTIEYFKTKIDKEIENNKNSVHCYFGYGLTTVLMEELIEYYKNQGWYKIKFGELRRNVTLLSKEAYFEQINKDREKFKLGENFFPGREVELYNAEILGVGFKIIDFFENLSNEEKTNNQSYKIDLEDEILKIEYVDLIKESLKKDNITIENVNIKENYVIAKFSD